MSPRADHHARERQRLASALKANLQRRKQQARSRAATQGAEGETGAPHDSAGFLADKTCGT